MSPVASQSLEGINWQTPVDLAPQFSGEYLLIHYGSPVVTAGNTVIVPVKTGATEGFQLQARDGKTGALKWTVTTDYLLPPHGWTPSRNLIVYTHGGAHVMYSALPALGLSAVSGALLERQFWLQLVGAMLLAYLGLKTLTARSTQQDSAQPERGLPAAFASTCLLTLANPMTILSFAAATGASAPTAAPSTAATATARSSSPSPPLQGSLRLP